MKNKIIHSHIFQSGGITLDNTLDREFDGSFVRYNEPDKIRNDKNFILNYCKEHSNLKAFSSHLIYYTPVDSDDIRFHNIAIIKHPIERIVDVYEFEKAQTPAVTDGAKKAKELSFADYVEWYMQDTSPATVRNSQSIFMAGMGPDISKVNDTVFSNTAKHLLSNAFTGIADRYSESMVVLEEYLSDYLDNIDLSYISTATLDKKKHKSIDEKVQKILSTLPTNLAKTVVEKNSYDIKLYNMANNLLDIKIASIEDFEKKLRNFKLRCDNRTLDQLKSMGNWEVLENEASASLERDDDNIIAHLRHIEALQALGKIEEAITATKTAVSRFPKNPWTYIMQIKNYLDKGDRLNAVNTHKLMLIKADREVSAEKYAASLLEK